jgi:NitT/TauT family transport system substrate-binding protein
VAQVTVGVLGTSSDVVFFYPDEQGWFEHMKIEPQFERFDSGGRMVASLATNQIQVAGGAPSVGLYNAIARRVDVKMVADRASGAPGYFLFVRKELIDSGQIRDYADLRGRRIAVAAMGTTAEVVVGRALEKAGLSLADAELVEIPYTDMMTALSTGAIDVGVAPEPTPTIAQQQGVAVKWHTAQEIVGNQQGSVLMYTGAFVDETPGVARDFMVAYLLGARLYNDAFVKRLPEAVTQVRDTILRRTTLRDPALLDQVEPVQTDPNGVMNRPGLAADYQWFREYGGLAETVDLDSLVDERYIQYAQSVLGPYR